MSEKIESESRRLLIYRCMSAAQRVSAACALHDFAHQRLVLYLEKKHPEASKYDVLRLAAKRFLGESATVL